MMRQINKIILLSFLIICCFIYKPVNAEDSLNGWLKQNNTIYFYENGNITKGIKEIEGKYYHFGENTGQ